MTALGIEALTPELVSSTDSRSQADVAALAFLVRYRVRTTREGYRRCLQRWFTWCDGHFIDPLHAERRHIELWSRMLEEGEGLALSTVAAHQNALAGFYRLAFADGIISRNPMEFVRRPQIERVSKREGLTRLEFSDMLEQAKAAGYRDHALVRILGIAGLRCGEALGIDIDKLQMYEGQYVAPLNRKGGKAQAFKFEPRTGWVIQQLIDLTGRTEGPLFVTRTGKRMDKCAAGRVVKRLAKAARITKTVTPHSLRHTFVTMSRAAGVPDHETQAATGHADSRMLDYYNRASRMEMASNATQAVAVFVERAS